MTNGSSRIKYSYFLAGALIVVIYRTFSAFLKGKLLNWIGFKSAYFLNTKLRSIGGMSLDHLEALGF